MFILEAGINHFGNENEAKYILNCFLKSKVECLTLQAQTKTFYENYKKKINFKLKNSFYKSAIKIAHKNNKKIGLAVCDLQTAKELQNINFDFYKLLSIAIKDDKLIKYLKTKKKAVYISTGKATDKDISKCINSFGEKKKLVLLHTPMSYEKSDLNLSRIKYLNQKFNIRSGYSHHYQNVSPIPLLMPLKPNCIFIYIKGRKRKGQLFPDNKHAIYFKQLPKLLDDCVSINAMFGKGSKANTKIKIFDEIKI